VQQLIVAFHAVESNSDAVPVLGDQDAMRVLIAWSKSEHTWKRPKGKAPQLSAANHHEVWRWIVSGWVYDLPQISLGAGVPPRVASEKMQVLVHNRLIYPDGSMSRAAKTALDVYVAMKLRIRPDAGPRQPVKDPKKPGSDNHN